MATHDYSLANQSGASFRTDLNNALAAIQSNNSNASSPATTVAYQWWADTNAGVLKIRNSSNNAWIELFQLDGTLTLEDGSNSAPALSFRSDLDTGVFRSGANTLDIATGGSVRATFSNSATTITGDLTIPDTIVHTGDSNTKIRFPSGDTISFELGGGGEKVRFNTGGVLFGTTSQRAGFFNTSSQFSPHFQIEGAGDSDDAGRTNSIIYNSTSNAGPVLIFGKTMGSSVGSTTVVTNGAQLGMISFQGMIGSEFTMGASIAAVVNGSIGDDDLPTDLQFATTSDGGSSAGEKMRLTESGRLGIGITNPTKMLELKAGNDRAGLRMTNTAPTTDNVFEILPSISGISNTGFCIRDHTDSSNRLVIDGSGLVGINTNTTTAHLNVEGNGNQTLRLKNTTGVINRIIFQDNASRQAEIIMNTGHLQFSPNSSGSVRYQLNENGQGSHNYTSDCNPKEIYNWSNNKTGMSFRSASTERGNIFFFDSGVQFNTSSDYRLKENVTSISDGITRIKQLIPRKFNWIVDESNTPVDGFLAHEVSSIVPEAINGTKDAVATQEDVDSGRSQAVGDPIHQMIDHSKLVPLLVAAVKELVAKVETLEAA